MELVIHTFGTSVSRDGNGFVITNQQGRKRLPADGLRSIQIGKGVQITSDAILLAIEYEIEVLFIEMFLSTKKKRYAIGLIILPIIIANVHSGWKGTLQRISVKTIEKMVNEFRCNQEDIIVCICPSIRKCHFEVEKDVQALFENEFKQDLQKVGRFNEIIERKSEQKWVIDTVEINKIILQNEGLKADNIFDCGICSVCNRDLIHSYRVEKEGYGLETSIIGLI